MATVPVVAVEGCTLSLVVNDSTRMVTGYILDRAEGSRPAEVELSAGPFTVRQTVGVGRTSGNIPRNRQWNFDGESDMTYALTGR